MFRWKTLAAFAFASTLAGASFAANPFSDVPRTHWAYEAIQKAVDAGILQGFDGKFHGDKLVNRYQMAVIVKKLLEAAGGSKGGGMGSDQLKQLEQLTIEFADELALLNTKVSTLEDSFVQLRGEVDKMKGGKSGNAGAADGLTQAFTGFVSVALVSTDDSAASFTGAGTVTGDRTRYTTLSPDQLFFTIPQASIGLDKEVGDGIGLHVQYDYGTNLTGGVLDGSGLTAPAVGLNEAYLLVEEIFGDIGAKIGGFALPFQSWEVNGPFRTCNYTITPSVINTSFEAARVVGMEIQRLKDVDPADFQWRLGIFTGADVGVGTIGGVGGVGIGFMTDNAGLAGLGNSNVFDDSFGFYLDLESGNDPDRSWGWRIGFFDMGGDNSNTAPTPSSEEYDGFQVGFWWKNDDFRVMLQYLAADAENAGGAGFSTDIDSWYILVNYQFNEDSSISLRYDDWENEVDTLGAATVLEGDGFTFAYNHKTSDTSMFQFEWLSPDEEVSTVGALSSDADDDLIQFRYKVWF